MTDKMKQEADSTRSWFHTYGDA